MRSTRAHKDGEEGQWRAKHTTPRWESLFSGRLRRTIGGKGSGTIALGTVGALREREARAVFEAGFEPMINAIGPSRIVVYGSRKSPVFDDAEKRGIEIVQFDSDTALVFATRSR